jgi:glycosyltransferase involved in cell wall biosynthesis
MPINDYHDMRKLRVILVTPTFFSRSSVIGGAERFVTELCKALRKYVDCRIVSFRRSGDDEISAPEYLHTYRALWYLEGRKINPVSVGFIPELFDSDIIHCHQISTIVSNQCEVIGKLLRKKIFLTDLGGGGFSFYDGLRLHKLADAFLCISRHSARRFVGYGKPSYVIYGGADVDFFRNSDQQREPRVVCVARISPHKGQDVLIRALPKGLGLDIIGQIEHQEYYRYLLELANGKDVQFHVDYHDTSEQRVLQAYSSAAATVLPSVFRDVFGQSWLPSPELLGLALLESMACETPVIASNAGGMPEIIKDGQTGFLFTPSDVEALANLLQWVRDNPEAARAMGKEGRRWVETNFTWDIVARKCLDAYRSTLSV